MQKNLSPWVSNLIIFITLIVLAATTLIGTAVLPVTTAGKQPIYRGNADEKQVSLMINVYWGTEYVLPMAQILKENGANATFFIGGMWAAQNNEIVKSLYDMGFELGNHGFRHADHKSLSLEANMREIKATEEILLKVTGAQPAKLFAPPSGSMGSDMYKACSQLDYDIIMWSRDTIDWRDKDSATVYKRAVKNMKNGDLILMHPTQHTLDALPDILAYCNQNGFSVVTVSANIGNQI